jgi:hypothetical protein
MRLSRPVASWDQLQASGEGLRRPLQGDPTKAGSDRPRFAQPRRGQTRAANLAKAGHAARAGVARGHAHGSRPCRWPRVARSALLLAYFGRAGDHRRPLVGSAVLRSQAATAALSLKRGRGPWRGLIRRDLQPPSAVRSTPENRPTMASSRSSIPSTLSARLARPSARTCSARQFFTNRWILSCAPSYPRPRASLRCCCRVRLVLLNHKIE